MSALTDTRLLEQVPSHLHRKRECPTERPSTGCLVKRTIKYRVPSAYSSTLTMNESTGATKGVYNRRPVIRRTLGVAWHFFLWIICCRSGYSHFFWRVTITQSNRQTVFVNFSNATTVDVQLPSESDDCELPFWATTLTKVGIGVRHISITRVVTGVLRRNARIQKTV